MIIFNFYFSYIFINNKINKPIIDILYVNVRYLLKYNQTKGKNSGIYFENFEK
jgi:hypothetical protein